jgi:hypothetical protein
VAGWNRNPFASDQHYAPYPAQDWPRDAVPTTPNDEQPYRNPTYAVPGPRVNPNLGYWTGAEQTLTLRAPDATAVLRRSGYVEGVIARAVWRSTVLDLSPDLRASASVTPVAAPVSSPAAWATKEEARLQVEFRKIKNVAEPGRFEIRYVEIGSTTTPENIVSLDAPQDVTPDFYASGWQDGATLYAANPTLVFRAPGHLRYWGVIVVIDLVSGSIAEESRFPWTVRGVAQ